MTCLDVSGVLMHWSHCGATKFSQCWTRNCPYMSNPTMVSGQIVRVVCNLEGNVWISGTERMWFEDYAGEESIEA